MSYRKKALGDLEMHAWYGKRVRGLSPADRKLIDLFIDENDGLSSASFILKMNATFIGITPNQALISELLLVINGLANEAMDTEHTARNDAQAQYLIDAKAVMADRDRIIKKLREGGDEE